MNRRRDRVVEVELALLFIFVVAMFVLACYGSVHGCHTPASRYPQPTSKPLALQARQERSLFDLAMIGDLNCDGTVNFDDINPFTLYLSDNALWQATYPGCPLVNGDCNGDRVYPDVGDTNGFVAAVNGHPQAVLIKGRVTDASGAPIPGVTINVRKDTRP